MHDNGCDLTRSDLFQVSPPPCISYSLLTSDCRKAYGTDGFATDGNHAPVWAKCEEFRLSICFRMRVRVTKSNARRVPYTALAGKSSCAGTLNRYGCATGECGCCDDPSEDAFGVRKLTGTDSIHSNAQNLLSYSSPGHGFLCLLLFLASLSLRPPQLS